MSTQIDAICYFYIMLCFYKTFLIHVLYIITVQEVNCPVEIVCFFKTS